MNRGYYYACNGMIMNQRKLDCIGNNLANMSTAGYKRDTIITNRFNEQMILVKHRQELSGAAGDKLRKPLRQHRQERFGTAVRDGKRQLFYGVSVQI